MHRILQPWQLFVDILAGWINEHQQAAIEYQREENRVLKEQRIGIIKQVFGLHRE
jgi:hypothetical protein